MIFLVTQAFQTQNYDYVENDEINKNSSELYCYSLCINKKVLKKGKWEVKKVYVYFDWRGDNFVTNNL